MENENIKSILRSLPNVENMESDKGNLIPNQFIISSNEGVLFQSYRSPIALMRDGKVYLFRDWNYSRTTGKYRNKFLGESTQETRKKLKIGEYIAVDFEVE